MSVIKTGFNEKVEQNPKEGKDYLLAEKTGKDGSRELVEKLVNYKEIQETNGTVEMWDAQKMKEAGIDLKPLTPRTTANSRIEGATKAAESANELITKIENEIK